MPRNGSGSYSLPNNTFYPGVNGITVQTADANTTMADIQSALSASVSADGQTPMSGDLNMGGNQLTSVGAPAALTDAATASDIQTARLTYLTGAAGTNTITASVPLLAALAAGESFQFIAAATNTSSVTLNINSIGAKAITKNGTTALVGGELIIGKAVQVIYDGTQFQLQGGGSSLTSGAALTPTGTTADFTGLPTGIKRITVSLNVLSTSGSSSPIIQIGDSGGIESSSYESSASIINSGTVTAAETVGYVFCPAAAFAYTYSGNIVLVNISGNTWTASGVLNLAQGGSATIIVLAGVKTLSATLDRIRITTVGGANTFDAGSVNILYE